MLLMIFRKQKPEKKEILTSFFWLPSYFHFYFPLFFSHIFHSHSYGNLDNCKASIKKRWRRAIYKSCTLLPLNDSDESSLDECNGREISNSKSFAGSSNEWINKAGIQDFTDLFISIGSYTTRNFKLSKITLWIIFDNENFHNDKPRNF